MRQLIVTTIAALCLVADAPLHAQTATPPRTPAASAPSQTIDPAKRAWFEKAVSDLLGGPDREAGHADVEEGRSSDH